MMDIKGLEVDVVMALWQGVSSDIYKVKIGLWLTWTGQDEVIILYDLTVPGKIQEDVNSRTPLPVRCWCADQTGTTEIHLDFNERRISLLKSGQINLDLHLSPDDRWTHNEEKIAEDPGPDKEVQAHI